MSRPFSKLRAAFAGLTFDEAAERALLAHPKPEVRLLTKEAKTWGYCGDYREFRFNQKESAPGTLTLQVPDDDYYREYFYGQKKGTARPIHVVLPYWETLWFVVDFKRVRKGLKRYIEVTALDALEHLNWIRLWPVPFLPAEFQPIHYWYGLGPAHLVCALALQANLARLQVPLLANGKDLTDPRSYNLLNNAFSPLLVNPRTLTRFLGSGSGTTWVTTSWRMDNALEAFQEVCETEGIQITATFVDPEIHGQPFPEFFELDGPRLVFDFVEKGQPVGLTGTVVDGLFRTAAVMGDDLLEWVFYPVLNGDNYEEYLQKAAGMLPGKPFVCYTSGQWSPVNEFEQTTHVQLASRVTAGGKSPDWLNDLLVTGVNAGIAAVGTAAGVPGLQLGALAGFVKDTVMAFHSLEDPSRAKEGGEWRFRETWAEASTTGLSVATVAGMKLAHHRTRSYVSHRIVVSNGGPYFAGKDVNVGDPVGVEQFDGLTEVDKVKELSYEDTRGTRGQLVLQVGSPDHEREPGALALGKLRKTLAWVNRLALSE